jgi:hypothetical protein
MHMQHAQGLVEGDTMYDDVTLCMQHAQGLVGAALLVFTARNSAVYR